MSDTNHPAASTAIFGDPTPLGLIGLAVGCAALTPIAFGYALTPAGFRTAAVWALLFGAGCQMISGLMSLTNKNVLGGTLFTAFSFMWVVNAWSLNGFANGQVPDPTILFALDIMFFGLFAVMAYGFGFFSSLLFSFIAVIDLLFLTKILKHFAACAAIVSALNLIIGILTVAMGAIALWLAFALLINPVAGKPIFCIGKPLFKAQN